MLIPVCTLRWPPIVVLRCGYRLLSSSPTTALVETLPDKQMDINALRCKEEIRRMFARFGRENERIVRSTLKEVVADEGEEWYAVLL